MPSSCWAPNCSNRLRKGCTVKMYRFPQSNAERMNRWIVQIGRLPPSGMLSHRADGLHEPKDHDRLCSDHFVKGKPSNDPNDIDYIPSIFKTSNKSYAKQLKEKPSPTSQSHRKRSCEQQASADSTTHEFTSYGADEREAALGMCLLQDTHFLQEATSQSYKKTNRTLKVVQLNNLVNSPIIEKLGTRCKEKGEAVQHLVKTQL